MQGNTSGGLEAFMAIEKQCRLAEDLALSKETCLAIVNALHEAGKWDELLENITTLTKRRGQLKSAIQVCAAATHAHSDVAMLLKTYALWVATTQLRDVHVLQDGVKYYSN